MQIIVILISISLILALIFLGIFFWNVKSGQYDDTYSPSVRILFDDTVNSENTKKKEEKVAEKEDVTN